MQRPICRFSLRRILQNHSAALTVDDPPFLDLLDGSKAAEAVQIVVQATIAYTRGLHGIIDVIH
jgi:hypothetical protein